jgi:hypothetical protein
MNLKKYLPFENYNLTTKLSNDDILKLIGENIQPKRAFSLKNLSYNYTKPYTGEVSKNSFKMSRNINYRNSFLPFITGKITSFLGETEVNIKMEPVSFVLIFMSVWLGVVGLVCIGMFLMGILRIKEVLQNGFSPMLLIPFLMFGFGYALTYFSFKVESKKSKEFLAKLLDGSEIE